MWHALLTAAPVPCDMRARTPEHVQAPRVSVATAVMQEVVTVDRAAMVPRASGFVRNTAVDIGRRGHAGRAPAGPECRRGRHALHLPKGADLTETDRVAFGGDRVDPATGTLAIRAAFDNADRVLIDRAFVTARLAQRDPVAMLTIPQAAMRRDRTGPFVPVVGADQTVAQRHVDTDRRVGHGHGGLRRSARRRGGAVRATAWL